MVFQRDKDENDDDTLQVYLISFSDANFTICIVESLSRYTRDFFFIEMLKGIVFSIPTCSIEHRSKKGLCC